VCITKDNTQLGVDGILYYQVTDPRLASYGSSNYIAAISQLAQTTLRSEIGKMELDKTFESRDEINRQIVAVARRGGAQLGHQGAALRDQEPDAAGGDPALDAAADHRRAREARADRQIRRRAPAGDQRRRRREAGRGAASEGEKQAAINKAQGDATAIRVIAEATAAGVRAVADAIANKGGLRVPN
jgi:regulator of protease activity HflC (stomatin/prohibitin superfamily)